MKQAELLVFTTPNYCMGASAQMKAFIDLNFNMWMVHKPKEFMFRKKAVIFSTTAGAGANQAMKIIKKSLFYLGVPYIRQYGISVQANGWNNVNDKKKIKIENDIDKLARKVKTATNVKPGIKTKMFFSIFSKMHSAGVDSDPSEKVYWQERGWLDKKRPWK